MLEPSQIVKFAGTERLNKLTFMEYCQHELLDSFFKQKGSEDFSFMGGTAIRVVYGGRRFSEDLDFDARKLNNFDDLRRRVVKDMKSKGFLVEFRLVHKGACHCYVKFPRLLYKLGLSKQKEEKLLIKIDASITEKMSVNNYLLNNYGVFRNIQVVPPEVLLIKKLLTIVNRKRAQGRDLYDVVWLWGMTKPNEEYLGSVIDMELGELLKKVLERVENLDLEKMQRRVKVFLVDAQDADKVKMFPKFIEQKMKEQMVEVKS